MNIITWTGLGYTAVIVAMFCGIFAVLRPVRRRYGLSPQEAFQHRPPADISRMCVCTFGNDGEPRPYCSVCHGTGVREPIAHNAICIDCANGHHEEYQVYSGPGCTCACHGHKGKA